MWNRTVAKRGKKQRENCSFNNGGATEWNNTRKKYT